MRCLPLLLALAAAGCFWAPPVPPAGPPDLLEMEAQDARAASEQAVKDYMPTVAGRIDDLAAPGADILQQLPGVAHVEMLVAVPKPTHRIIHIRDYHFVPEDLFVLDQRAAGRTIPEEAVDGQYHRFQLQVELVQLEQSAILRCLAQHHGLKQILAEGLTAKNLKEFQDEVAELREIHERVAALVQKRNELANPNPALDQQINRALDERPESPLEYGAAGRLAVAADVKVLPLDDDLLLAAARPTAADDDRLRIDPAALEARHDAQVQAALASGPVSVLILGGEHDLSASVRRLDGGTAEYMRVTTARYREFAGAK